MMLCWLTIWRLLSRGSSEQKIKALSTIANILQGEPDNMTENFFQALDLRASGTRLPSMVELLFDMIKQPFADMTQVKDSSFYIRVTGFSGASLSFSNERFLKCSSQWIATPKIRHVHEHRKGLKSVEGKIIHYWLIELTSWHFQLQMALTLPPRLL